MTNSDEKQSLYIGNVLKYERNRKGLKAEDVCSGICTVKTYGKLESGVYVGGIHLKRALFERLGIYPGRAGVYLCSDEYEEVGRRIEILDLLRRSAASHITAREKISAAKEKLLEYDRTYLHKKDIFNRQFSLYMHARLMELAGDRESALNYYLDAAACTIPALKKYSENMEYNGKIDIPSRLTLDEFFLSANIARLLEEYDDAHKKISISIYQQLLSCCEEGKPDVLTLVYMYPKAVCGLLKAQPPEMLGNYDRRNILKSCDKALELLRRTSKLYFVLPLIGNKRVLMKLLGEKLDSHWEAFAASYEY